MWQCDIRYAAAGNGKWIVHLDTQDAHSAKSERLALENEELNILVAKYITLSYFSNFRLMIV